MNATGPGQTASNVTVVVMGVSGSGKTTVALRLVDAVGWPYAEGDDFHPVANVEKMRSGHALDDDDRWPWLEKIAGWIGERESAGENAIVTCSALKRAYRDVLRNGHPSVFFAHVDATHDALAARLQSRTGHYMPASLLDSQLKTLEPLEDDEPGLVVSGEGSADEVTARLLEALREERGLKTDNSPDDSLPGSR